MTRQKEQQTTEKGHYNTGTPTWSYLFLYDNLEVWPHGLQYKNWKTISLFNPLLSSHCLPPIIPIGPLVPGHFANKCCLALVEPSSHNERKKCPKQAHCRLLPWCKMTASSHAQMKSRTLKSFPWCKSITISRNVQIWIIIELLCMHEV